MLWFLESSSSLFLSERSSIDIESFVATKLSISIDDLSDRNKLEELSKNHNIEDYKSCSDGKLQFELFEKVVEDDLIEPTFIIDYPVEVSPLS